MSLERALGRLRELIVIADLRKWKDDDRVYFFAHNDHKAILTVGDVHALLREHAEPGPVDGLLPCPFCGFVDIDDWPMRPDGGGTAYNSPVCMSCGATIHENFGTAETTEAMHEAWNRRTAPAPGANAVRVIRKGLEEAMRYLNSDYPEEDDGMTADQACERARVAVIDAIAALAGKEP